MVKYQLVIVLASHGARVALLETERDSVLIVHTDAVPTLLIALQCFQTVARHGCQIGQTDRRIEVCQPTPNSAPKILREASRRLCVQAVEDVLRSTVIKRPNHNTILRMPYYSRQQHFTQQASIIGASS